MLLVFYSHKCTINRFVLYNSSPTACVNCATRLEPVWLLRTHLMRSLCVCPCWPQLGNPTLASVLKRIEESLVLKFLLDLNLPKLLCTVKIVFYMIALLRSGFKTLMAPASFNIHISAAPADKVSNKYVIRWLGVIKVDGWLWLTVRRTHCQAVGQVVTLASASYLLGR